MGEGLAVSTVECFQVYTIKTDACAHGYDGAQQFAMLTGIERRAWQLVPALLLALVSHMPDKVIISLGAEPCFQHVAYAVALALPAQQAPCALQQ